MFSTSKPTRYFGFGELETLRSDPSTPPVNFRTPQLAWCRIEPLVPNAYIDLQAFCFLFFGGGH